MCHSDPLAPPTLVMYNGALREPYYASLASPAPPAPPAPPVSSTSPAESVAALSPAPSPAPPSVPPSAASAPAPAASSPPSATSSRIASRSSTSSCPCPCPCPSSPSSPSLERHQLRAALLHRHAPLVQLRLERQQLGTVVFEWAAGGPFGHHVVPRLLEAHGAEQHQQRDRHRRAPIRSVGAVDQHLARGSRLGHARGHASGLGVGF
mmetsp:Transcript_83396/g.235064  ORF Transcript_83396/g.235064 Transcript_83396/m.235064 type:complete len:208 (-) Transcript_83396:1242-1865(-)